MSVRRNTGYNLIGAIIPVALSLITVPLYLKLIGVERYGVLAIAWLLLGYFGLFDLGLGRATSFRIAAMRNSAAQARANTFWAALSVNIGLGLCGGAVLWAAAEYFFAHVFRVDEIMRQEILAGVPLLGASVPVATLIGVLTGALQGREKFLETNTISVFSTALFQVIPLGLAWAFGPNIVLLLSGALFARFLTAVVLSFRCHVEIVRGSRLQIVRSEITSLLAYGGWVSLTSIFGPLLLIVDRFTIGAVLGAVAVTVYTVPFQLAQRFAILPASLTNALFPRLCAADSVEREALSDNASRAMVGLMTLPVLGAIFLMGPFLHLWVGARVGAQSAPIGRIVLIGFWLNAFALIPFVRLQASGRPDVVSKFILAELLPYFAALYVGLRYFGFNGCAVAFSLRCICDYIFLSWFANGKIANFQVISLMFGQLILAALIAGSWSTNSWQWWISGAALSSLVIGMSWRTLPGEMKDRFLHSDAVRVVMRCFKVKTAES